MASLMNVSTYVYTKQGFILSYGLLVFVSALVCQYSETCPCDHLYSEMVMSQLWFYHAFYLYEVVCHKDRFHCNTIPGFYTGFFVFGEGEVMSIYEKEGGRQIPVLIVSH